MLQIINIEAMDTLLTREVRLIHFQKTIYYLHF